MAVDMIEDEFFFNIGLPIRRMDFLGQDRISLGRDSPTKLMLPITKQIANFHL